MLVDPDFDEGAEEANHARTRQPSKRGASDDYISIETQHRWSITTT